MTTIERSRVGVGLRVDEVARYGRTAFHRAAPTGAPWSDAAREARLAYDVDSLATAEERDAEIWSALIHERRAVSRAAYDELADELAAAPSRRLRRGRHAYRYGSCLPD